MRERNLIKILFFLALAMGFILPIFNIYFLNPSFTTLIINEAEADALRVARHMADMLALRMPPVSQMDDAAADELKREIENDMKYFQLLKFRIFSESGAILFSTDAAEIERGGGGGYPLRREVYSRYMRAEQKSAEGREVETDTVKTYVPLLSGKGRMMGAFEIYHDITGKKERIDSLLSYSSVFVIVVALGFLFVVLIVSARAFAAMKKTAEAQEALVRSEERYRAIIEDQTELVCRFLPNGTLTFANEAYCRYFGKKREELIGCNSVPHMPDEDRELTERRFSLLSEDNPFVTYEHRITGQEGETRWLQLTDRAVFDRSGRIIECQSVGRDVTEQKRAGEQLEASLQEKEALLREVHHRVKNNLQIVSSMLQLQSMNGRNEDSLRPLRESQDRVKSLALVYENLCRTEDFTSINLENYVRDLAASLYRSLRADTALIRFHLDIKNIRLSMDSAILCGLIVNELVTNSLLHAFPDGREGEIRVGCVNNGATYTLTICDSGKGFLPGKDIRNTGSLGLKLVDILTDQLGGSLRFDGHGKTEFMIEFKEPQNRER